MQHARLPCPSSAPGACSNSCPLSWGCHPTISSSVVPFSSCPQSFPASGSFPTSWLFASGGQRIGASASVLPMNIQGWFPLGLTGLISLLFKGLSRVTKFSRFEKSSPNICYLAQFLRIGNLRLASYMVLAQGFPWGGSKIVGWGVSRLRVDFGCEWEEKWKYLVFKSVVQKKYEGFIHILELSLS